MSSQLGDRGHRQHFTPEEQAMLRAIATNPKDLTPAHPLVDSLMERGSPLAPVIGRAFQAYQSGIPYPYGFHKRYSSNQLTKTGDATVLKRGKNHAVIHFKVSPDEVLNISSQLTPEEHAALTPIADYDVKGSAPDFDPDPHEYLSRPPSQLARKYGEPLLTPTEHALVQAHAQSHDTTPLLALADSLEERDSPLHLVVRRAVQAHRIPAARAKAWGVWSNAKYEPDSEQWSSMNAQRAGSRGYRVTLSVHAPNHSTHLEAPITNEEMEHIKPLMHSIVADNVEYQSPASMKSIPAKMPKSAHEQLARPTGGIDQIQDALNAGVDRNKIYNVIQRASINPSGVAGGWYHHPDGRVSLFTANNKGQYHHSVHATTDAARSYIKSQFPAPDADRALKIGSPPIVPVKAKIAVARKIPVATAVTKPSWDQRFVNRLDNSMYGRAVNKAAKWVGLARLPHLESLANTARTWMGQVDQVKEGLPLKWQKVVDNINDWGTGSRADKTGGHQAGYSNHSKAAQALDYMARTLVEQGDDRAGLIDRLENAAKAHHNAAQAHLEHMQPRGYNSPDVNPISAIKASLLSLKKSPFNPPRTINAIREWSRDALKAHKDGDTDAAKRAHAELSEWHNSEGQTANIIHQELHKAAADAHAKVVQDLSGAGYTQMARGTLQSAVTGVMSDRQRVRRMLATKIAAEAKLKLSGLTDAIAVGDGAKVRDALVQRYDHADDANAVTLAAAWYGLLAQEPRTLVFHAHPGGPDSLHVWHTQARPQDVKSAADRLNIPHLVMGTDGTAYAYDAGNRSNAAITRLKSATGNPNAPDYTVESGTAHVIGAGQGSSSDARATYRDLIKRASVVGS